MSIQHLKKMNETGRRFDAGIAPSLFGEEEDRTKKEICPVENFTIVPTSSREERYCLDQENHKGRLKKFLNYYVAQSSDTGLPTLRKSGGLLTLEDCEMDLQTFIRAAYVKLQTKFDRFRHLLPRKVETFLERSPDEVLVQFAGLVGEEEFSGNRNFNTFNWTKIIADAHERRMRDFYNAIYLQLQHREQPYRHEGWMQAPGVVGSGYSV